MARRISTAACASRCVLAGWRRLCGGRRPDRGGQEGRRGELVLDPDHQPAGAAGDGRVREEISGHQGAGDPRQRHRGRGQDSQREPRRAGAVRCVRRHHHGRAAEEGRLRAAMAAGRRQGLSGRREGHGRLLDRQQPVHHHAWLQHHAGAARHRAQDLSGPAQSEMARQARLERLPDQFGPRRLRRHGADRDGTREGHGLSARTLQAERRQSARLGARGARPGDRRRISRWRCRSSTTMR